MLPPPENTSPKRCMSAGTKLHTRRTRKVPHKRASNPFSLVVRRGTSISSRVRTVASVMGEVHHKEKPLPQDGAGAVIGADYLRGRASAAARISEILALISA